MLKRVIALLLLLVLCLYSVAYAQAATSFAAVEVDLWPEFDRPIVLVIYRITLSPQTSLPVEIGLRIPGASGTPNAVAARQPDGSLVNIPYKQEPGGEWSRLVFQATTPELQVEYYDSKLGTNARHYQYNWPGDYTVQAMTISAQQPLGATDMRISPSLGTGTPAADGLTYYTAQVGSLTQGQAFTITMDYQKANDDLSSQSLPVEPSGPLNDSALGRATMMSALPWLLGGLGLILLVGGGIWYWQSGRNKGEPRRQWVRHKPAAQAENEEAEGNHIYCHQCGKRASPGDRFCRACGTTLRIGE
jgi:hypothetical protein